jgi:hypothetical protein
MGGFGLRGGGAVRLFRLEVQFFLFLYLGERGMAAAAPVGSIADADGRKN